MATRTGKREGAVENGLPCPRSLTHRYTIRQRVHNWPRHQTQFDAVFQQTWLSSVQGSLRTKLHSILHSCVHTHPPAYETLFSPLFATQILRSSQKRLPIRKVFLFCLFFLRFTGNLIPVRRCTVGAMQVKLIRLNWISCQLERGSADFESLSFLGPTAVVQEISCTCSTKFTNRWTIDSSEELSLLYL